MRSGTKRGSVKQKQRVNKHEENNLYFCRYKLYQFDTALSIHLFGIIHHWLRHFEHGENYSLSNNITSLNKFCYGVDLKDLHMSQKCFSEPISLVFLIE